MKVKHVSLLWFVILSFTGISIIQIVSEFKSSKASDLSLSVVPSKGGLLELPVSDEMADSDKAVLSAAFNDPTAMDAPPSPGPVETSKVETTSRRRLLSQVERAPEIQIEREPVEAKDLYFWDDFSSLRTKAIRDANSPEHKAGVVALMKVRQRRLEQNN